MKVVKPDKLSVLQRTFEHEGRPQFVLSLLCGFYFDRPRALMGEPELWTIAADELESENTVIDEGNVKVRAELLVNGKCFPPGDEPAAVSFARIELGRIDKRLAVIGDRFWKRGVQTEPEPFTEMPVDWHHAFGGEGYELNPVGKGCGSVEVEGDKLRPLPNIEHEKQLVNSPQDRPKPAGFGAYDFTWPQRFEKIGTYDRTWLKTRYPGYAADMDPTLFNAAPDDQQLDGYFEGTEEFVVENMHPQRPRLEGRLPEVVSRAFVTHRAPDGEESFKEIAMRLDTVRLIPHREMGILVFRGVLEIAEDDAADVVHLVAALEAPGKPRSAEHYSQALALRLDKEKGALMALKNEDLMPPEEDGYAPSPETTDIERWVHKEDLLAKNMRRRMDQEYADARERMLAQGFSSADVAELELPPDDSDGEPPTIDELVRQMEGASEEADREKHEAEQKKVAADAQAREQFAAMGLDYDQEVEKALQEAAGPPNFTAAKQLAWMKSMLTIAREGGAPLEELEQQADDPEFYAELQRMEQALLDNYRRGAHMNQAFAAVARDDSDMFRAEIEAAHHNGIPLQDRDFSGADLSGLDLRGMNLKGAFLESVNLTDTDLTDADLDGAVLAHATLRRTKLCAAKLSGVNLGSATLEQSDLSRCDLTGAVLARAKLSRCSLRGADLSRANLLEAEFGEEMNFSECVARDTMFIKLDLRKAAFRRADLAESVWYGVDLRDADFSGASMTKVALVSSCCDGARFCAVTADKLQFVHEVTAHRADFSGAHLPSALMRGLDLREAKLDLAFLDMADLSGSDLTAASLYQVRARQALMIRTNFTGAHMVGSDLLGAIMQKAKLNGADLHGANLYGADLAKARVDGDTNIEDANLKRSRQIPRASDGPQ